MRRMDDLSGRNKIRISLVRHEMGSDKETNIKPSSVLYKRLVL